VIHIADNALVRAVAGVPITVRRKLLVAFACVVVLLVGVGVLGISVLSQSNIRGEALGQLPQRVAAYRELATDSDQLNSLFQDRGYFIACLADPKGPYCRNSLVCTLSDLCHGRAPTSATVTAVDGAIRTTLDLAGPLTVAADLGFAPPSEERSLMTKVHLEYEQLDTAIGTLIAGDQAGTYSGNAPETEAATLTAQTDQLVNVAEAATARLVAQGETSYISSQHLFVGVAGASAALALLLGVILSWAIVEPIRRMRDRLAAIGTGDFSGHVTVPNRDELGALAADLNRMNDELGRLYRELEDASRHKSEFLANMSHELRTPLNAVIEFSEILEDRLCGDLNAKQAEYVGDIHTSGRHLLTLINDILDVSKIEAGRMQPRVTAFRLPEVLRNSVALFRERATRHGIRLGLAVDPGVGIIEADERMLKQVVFNLLSNGLNFTARGGHVDVTARGDGDDIVVSVSDDGVGIALRDQARIFQEFEQVGTSGSQEGTGLGLALARRFVELHRGSLWVESAPGHGSTFTFKLPLNQRPSTVADTDGVSDREFAGATVPTTVSNA
jgi:signal transduction histidine kinase